MLEANYLLAEKYFAAGDHDTAIRIFEALGDFSDAPERLKEVTYAQAESLLDAGEFDRAIRLFLSLEEYNGAGDRARNELYAQGERLLAAGDYDEAADIFGSLGAYSDARERLKEAKYAKAMDNLQPAMLNAATNGRAWKEHEVKLSKILKRNENTEAGTAVLWQYGLKHFVEPHVAQGNIQNDVQNQPQ